MIWQSLSDLWFGFGVALEPHNLMWSFFGVLVGNLIGVLPGMGALSAIAMLLPLTYTMHPVPAFLMLAAPLLVAIAFKFGPKEIFSIMLLGLIAGSTMARGSPMKGIAMTTFGLMLGTVGTDVNSGVQRFTLGFAELSDRVELVALAMGL